jgi:putative ABC transport system ATP-binding protein
LLRFFSQHRVESHRTRTEAFRSAGSSHGIEFAPSYPGKNNQKSAGIDMVKREGQRVFSARNLTKVYHMGETEVHALRGVDLDLFEGECVVLLGPSGSGKSTLLNILGGLDAATQGQVHYRDHDLVQASAQELTRFRREHVGFVFQFYNLIPSLTAAENIALVTDLVDQPMDVKQALSLVGLEERADHFPSQLSGGEQQRIAMARAVAKRPDILLCDEPTGALDFQTGKLVLETILKINEELGTLVVVITHNAAIAGLADRVIHLADGQISQIEVNPQRKKVDEILW